MIIGIEFDGIPEGLEDQLIKMVERDVAKYPDRFPVKSAVCVPVDIDVAGIAQAKAEAERARMEADQAVANLENTERKAAAMEAKNAEVPAEEESLPPIGEDESGEEAEPSPEEGVAVKVIDSREQTESSRVRLWPGSHAGESLSVELDASSVRRAETREGILDKLATELAEKIAQKFYDRPMADFEKE